jgi:hypothetical protein
MTASEGDELKGIACPVERVAKVQPIQNHGYGRVGAAFCYNVRIESRAPVAALNATIPSSTFKSGTSA